MLSLVYFIEILHSKIVYIFSGYPLFVGKIFSGVIFGFLLGFILYLFLKKNIFYTSLFTIIILGILYYFSIITIDIIKIKNILGFSIDNQSNFIEELKIFSEYYILEIVISFFVAFLTCIFLKKYFYE